MRSVHRLSVLALCAHRVGGCLHTYAVGQASLHQLASVAPRARPLCSCNVAESWSSMTVVDLKAALRERSLPVNGRKAELIERLVRSEGNARISNAYSAEDENDGPVTMTAATNAAANWPDATKEFIVTKCAELLGLERWRVANAVSLFKEDNTLPFIARYRKEATGTMDETALRSLEAALDAAEKLELRRASVLASISKLDKLTPDLREKLESATLSATELEDLYLPYRPKRRTKASNARSAGLQPLADALMRRASAIRAVDESSVGEWLDYRRPLIEVVGEFVRRLQGAMGCDEALQGALNIVAEEATEEAGVRALARQCLHRAAVLTSKEKNAGSDANGKYTLYHSFRMPLHRVLPHQVLAINRGEASAGALSVSIEVAEADRLSFEGRAVSQLVRQGETASSNIHPSWDQALEAALADGTKRLLVPSLVREWRRSLTERAEEQSFAVYEVNLRQKLLQPPLKGHVVAAIDPGLRTGCKLAVVSPTGSVLATDTLMLPLGEPADSGRFLARAAAQLFTLLQTWGVSLIAIGNGTGGREAETLVKHVLSQYSSTEPNGQADDAENEQTANAIRPHYMIVDEAGASVYSASELAVSELPEMDVAHRGAVSLARRAQDPLSELVKVDPKALGVGMYQHDVDQKRLAVSLDKVVESAVNAVGIDLNVASPALLAHIAGLNERTARSIVETRERLPNGRFERVDALKTVRGVGPKAYEQAAGFLRVYDGDEPLDATAVHPESYAALRKAVEQLQGRNNALPDIPELECVAMKLGVGVPTLEDALDALRLSGSDPRDDLLGVAPPILLSGSEHGTDRVAALADLEIGDELWGVVKNVVDFGAFIDVGVGVDGLLHISEIRKKSHDGRGGSCLQVGTQLRVRISSLLIENLKQKQARIGLQFSADTCTDVV